MLDAEKYGAGYCVDKTMGSSHKPNAGEMAIHYYGQDRKLTVPGQKRRRRFSARLSTATILHEASNFLGVVWPRRKPADSVADHPHRPGRHRRHRHSGAATGAKTLIGENSGDFGICQIQDERAPIIRQSGPEQGATTG